MHGMLISIPDLLCASPSQVIPTIFVRLPKQIFGIHLLFSWVATDIGIVKCLAHEQNTISLDQGFSSDA